MKGSLQVVRAGGGAPTFREVEAYAGLGYHLPPSHLFRDSIQNLQNYGAFGAELTAAPSDIPPRPPSRPVPASRREPRRARQRGSARRKRSTEKSAQPRSQPDQHTRPEWDDDCRARPRHAYSSRSPATTPCTSVDDSRRRAVAGVLHDERSTTTRWQPNAKQAAIQLKVSSARTTSSSRSRGRRRHLPAGRGNRSQWRGRHELRRRVDQPGRTRGAGRADTTPSVRTDPNTTLYSLQQVAKQTPFKLMLRTVVESSSRLHVVHSRAALPRAPHSERSRRATSRR